MQDENREILRSLRARIELDESLADRIDREAARMIGAGDLRNAKALRAVVRDHRIRATLMRSHMAILRS